MRGTVFAQLGVECRLQLFDGVASEVLYEFTNEEALLNKQLKIRFFVPRLAAGTGHLVYDGAYIFHSQGSEQLVRYALVEEGNETALVRTLGRLA